jgi:phosphatidylserine decarboxylase
MEKQPQVRSLERLLSSDNALKESVEISIKKAALPSIANLEDFYNFLDGILTHIPTEHNLMPSVREFYHILSHSPGDLLKTHVTFNLWIDDLVNTRVIIWIVPCQQPCSKHSPKTPNTGLKIT